MVVMTPSSKSGTNLLNQEVKSDEENDVLVAEDIRIIAQEVEIVKSLACNDVAKRNRQMKRLRRWLQMRTKSSFPFCQEDFLRIWKGLYYNMWYSDKPLVQEDLAEQLGKLLECFTDNLDYSVDFFGAFLKTMCNEWFGIDQWRIDKYLLLVRRMLRYMLKLLKSSDWSLSAINLFNKHATETVIFENVSAKGLTMHYIDIFFEELAKVSGGNISAKQVGFFVKPYIKFMAVQRDSNLVAHCRTRVFCHLLYQSALGREYTDKYNAWKSMGFPTKNINDLEKVELEHDDNEEENIADGNESKHLDPRAGNVDVFMPELPLDAQFIIEEIEHFLCKEECTTKRRKALKKLLNLFQSYKSGKFPLGIKRMPRFEGKCEKPLMKEKINQLDNLENELYGVDRKLKQMTKRKRRKFLKSIDFHEIDESNYEQCLNKALPKSYLKERRKRSYKSLITGWLEEELNDEELKPKKLRKETIPNGKQSVKNNSIKKREFRLHNSIDKESIDPAKKFKKQENSTSEAETVEVPAKKASSNVECNNVSKNKSSALVCTPKSSDSEEKVTSETKPRAIKVLKISNSDEEPKTKFKKHADVWEQPLGEGEVEYFFPSRKLLLEKANADLVLNPLAKQRSFNKQSTLINSKVTSFSATNSPKTPSSTKRVKIALKRNTSQNPIEYIQQIKSSPNIPYDAKRKPGKGLLKPHSMPSPINPFYKKKIGLKLLNDTV